MTNEEEKTKDNVTADSTSNDWTRIRIHQPVELEFFSDSQSSQILDKVPQMIDVCQTKSCTVECDSVSDPEMEKESIKVKKCSVEIQKLRKADVLKKYSSSPEVSEWEVSEWDEDSEDGFKKARLKKFTKKKGKAGPKRAALNKNSTKISKTSARKEKTSKRPGKDPGSDSDFFDNDDETYTKDRKLAKEIRHQKRVTLIRKERPADLEGNKNVIESFVSFLRVTYNITGWMRKTSTYRFSMGHLFTYEDSLLNFELNKDTNFKLEQLTDFNHSKYRELADPTEWLMSIAEDRVERLKAWKRLVLFIKDQLNESRVKCGTNTDALVRFQLLISNLDNLFKKVCSSNIDKKAKIVNNFEKRARENAEEYMSPNKRLSEKDSVKNWFNSKQYKKEYDDVVQIWSDATNQSTISEKNFTKLALFTKFYLMLTSKNRNSVYKFTNNDYMLRKALWIEDTDNLSLENLQCDYITEPPKDDPNKPANCWIIKLSGSGAGIKNQEAQVIYINKPCQELLHKYSDIKDFMLPNEDANGPFFVKLDSTPLPDIANTKGSLWSKFAEASNLDKSSMNTIRRGLEYEVQVSPAALASIKDIQSHSKETGSGAYDKTSPYRRACFLTKVANKEANTNDNEEELPANIKEVRSKREAKQKQQCTETAKITMKRKRQNRRGISKTTRLLPEDRVFIQEVFLDENNEEIYEALKRKFPVNSVFKRFFYRLLDGKTVSMSDETKQRLIDIEERIFLSIKEEIENSFEQFWENSSTEMNNVADRKVCFTIRNSLYYFEKNRPKEEKKLFNFSLPKVKC